MLRIFDDTAIARRELLSRRPEGEVERPADVRERQPAGVWPRPVSVGGGR